VRGSPEGLTWPFSCGNTGASVSRFRADAPPVSTLGCDQLRRREMLKEETHVGVVDEGGGITASSTVGIAYGRGTRNLCG
jgi:hypothetical protein